jgi:ATP-dependent Clp protease ATP-binding subunit ClpB
MLTGIIRDGDIVKIRISGDVLDIQENHAPDPTVIRQADPEKPPIGIEDDTNLS